MTSSLRKFLIVSTFSIGVSASAACSGKEESTADILAQDSSLAREVMSANLDTAVMISSIDSMELSADPVESTRPPVASTGTVFGADRVEPAISPEPAAQPAARATISRSTTPPRRAARSSAPSRPRRVYNSARVSRSAIPGTRLRGSAMIPAGSELSFAADERICTSTGDVVARFSTRLAEDVVGPIGVVIPKGSIATGLVAARGNASIDNPERAIHIQSLTFGGRTYSLSSEVTAAQLDKKRTPSRTSPSKVVAGAGVGAIVGRVIGGNTTSTVIGAASGAAAGAVVANRTTGFNRCVPTGGLITARLTEPLRVALSE